MANNISVNNYYSGNILNSNAAIPPGAQPRCENFWREFREIGRAVGIGDDEPLPGSRLRWAAGISLEEHKSGACVLSAIMLNTASPFHAFLYNNAHLLGGNRTGSTIAGISHEEQESTIADISSQELESTTADISSQELERKIADIRAQEQEILDRYFIETAPPAYRRFTLEELRGFGNGMDMYVAQRHSDSFGFENVSQNLRKLSLSGARADYTGMTDAEKFMAINERWDEIFPGFRLSWSRPQLGFTAVYAIERQYHNELKSVFGCLDRAMAAQREALFGDKTDSEIRAAIAANYPPAGQITLREFDSMLLEMQQVGVDEGIAHLLGTNAPYGLVREAMLDKPLDIRMLTYNFNMHINAKYNAARPFMKNAGRALQDIFGVNVSMDHRGNIASTNHNPVDFIALMKQLQERFINMTDSEIERWLEELFPLIMEQ